MSPRERAGLFLLVGFLISSADAAWASSRSASCSKRRLQRRSPGSLRELSPTESSRHPLRKSTDPPVGPVV